LNREPSRDMRVGLGRDVTESAKKAGEDQTELIWLEYPQLSNRPYVWICRYVLDQECARLQEWDINGNLVLGIAKAGGMREDGDQGAVITRAGRTFSAMPRSKSHTSPRLGLIFLSYKVAKKLVASQGPFLIV
jgi:hypothetical protein